MERETEREIERERQRERHRERERERESNEKGMPYKYIYFKKNQMILLYFSILSHRCISNTDTRTHLIKPDHVENAKAVNLYALRETS